MATLNDPNVAANIAAVKAASTAPVATDPALVVTISPNTAATGNLRTDLEQVAGSAVSTAASGVQKVGVVGGTGTSLEATAGTLNVNQNLVANSAIATAAAGVQKVGVVGNTNAAIDGAIGAAPPANALQVGMKAATANPTNATAGNQVAMMADKAGRLVVTPSHVRDLVGIQTTNIAASTAETTIVTAGGANVFNDISCLVITSTDAAAATITIKDATGGTTRMVLDYPNAALAPGAPCVIPFPVPMPQAAANNNWTATVSVNAGSVKITAVFIKNL